LIVDVKGKPVVDANLAMTAFSKSSCPPPRDAPSAVLETALYHGLGKLLGPELPHKSRRGASSYLFLIIALMQKASREMLLSNLV